MKPSLLPMNFATRASRSPVPQSQRDCVLQPKVARHELPWVAGRLVFNPNGVASRFHDRATTPLGLLPCRPVFLLRRNPGLWAGIPLGFCTRIFKAPRHEKFN